MGIRQVAAMDRLRFRPMIEAVERALRRIGVKAQSEIQIYPCYEDGWEATVAANDRAFIFTCKRGRFKLRIEEVIGFYPNGNLMTRPFPKRYIHSDEGDRIEISGIELDPVTFIDEEMDLDPNMFSE